MLSYKKLMSEQNPELNPLKTGEVKDSNDGVEFQAEDIPEPLVEFLKELPQEERNHVESAIRLTMGMGRISSSQSSPIAKHINSGHIDKIIESANADGERKFKEHNTSETTKRMTMGSLLILVLMVLIYSGTTKDKELSEKIMTLGSGFLGGLGAGAVLNRVNKRDED
jgi:hypothetical protein